MDILGNFDKKIMIKNDQNSWNVRENSKKMIKKNTIIHKLK